MAMQLIIVYGLANKDLKRGREKEMVDLVGVVGVVGVVDVVDYLT